VPSKRTISARRGGGGTPSIPERLRRSHTHLNRLARQLDIAVPPNGFEFAVLGIGQRSRTLFRAIGHLVDRRDAEIAVPTLLRPLVEMNVLLRFLAVDPELHTELWYAEGERNVVTLVDEFSSSRGLAGRWARLVSVNIDPAAFASRREAVERVRDKARAAGVAGVAKTGAVLPSITHQQRATGDLVGLIATLDLEPVRRRPGNLDVLAEFPVDHFEKPH